MRIFISYRRDDSAGHAGRLFDFLRDHFGGKSVFMDIDTIEPGDDFRKAVHDALGTCDVVLVMIGRQWLNILDTQGRRRLDDKEDWVRVEIATALANPKIRVIPVLVRGAAMPGERDLPDDLKELTWRNALELSDSRFQHDASRLVKVIERKEGRPIPFLAGKHVRWTLGLLGIIVLLAVSAYFLDRSRKTWQVPPTGGTQLPPTGVTTASSTVPSPPQRSTTPAPVQVNMQALNQPAPAVIISQMLVSWSDTYYQVEVTIRNPRSQDALLTKVRLFGRSGMQCNSMPHTYRISDTINIQGKEGEALKAEGAISQEGSSFQYPLEGRFVVGPCGELNFEFSFDTHVILPAGEYTDFFLDIPRSLKTTTSESVPSDTEPPDIQLSGLLERYSQIGVELGLDDLDRTVAYTLEKSRTLSPAPSTIHAGKPVVQPLVPPSAIEPVPSGALVGWTTYQTQNFVTDIAMSTDGTIWAGGPEGIVRYDPNSGSAAVYTTLDGLPSAAITSIAVTEDGSVWFGTESSGVLRFDGVSWLGYTKDQGLASNSITDLAAAPDGTIWLATQDAGVIHLDGGTWQVYDQGGGLPDNSVGSIDVDASGQVWITPGDSSTSQYLVIMFDGRNWNVYGVDRRLQVNAIAFQEDRVWLATNDGAWRLANDGWTRFSRSQGLVSNSIDDILVTPDHSIWLASDSGVSRFDGSDWFTYDTGSGLVSDHVNTIASAPDGSIWFGTNGSGITRLRDQQWSSYATADCMPPSQLLTDPIAVSDQLLWMQFNIAIRRSTDPGNDILFRFDQEKCSSYGYADLAADQAYLDLYDSKLVANGRGQVWFGTGSGLFQFDAEKWKKILDANSYTDVVAPDDGSVWYSTYDGVKKFDGSGWTDLDVEYLGTLIDTPAGVLGVDWPGSAKAVLRLYDFNKQKSDEFTVNSYPLLSGGLYAVTGEGDVWFSFGGLLYRYHDAILDPYSVNDGIISDKITSLAAGPDNTLWVGTEAGASYFDGKNWRNFTTSDGLVADQIQAIGVDRRGWVWIGTPQGVSVYDGITWSNFTTLNSGLAGNNVLRILIAPNGRSIWFHTTSGFSQYTPAK